MPAAPVASRTPPIAVMEGTFFGARGEMAVTTRTLVVSSWPGIAVQRTASLRSPMPGHQRLEPLCCKDMDARHKAGHDESEIRHFFAGAAGLSVAGSGAGAGLSRRSIWADLRRLST